MFSYRCRAYQPRTARIDSDEREDFAMRDCAGKGEQRTVAAKKRQRVGQRDKGLLQDVVGFIGGAAERARDKTPDARTVAIEKLVRRIFVASPEPRYKIGFRLGRRLGFTHQRNAADRF